MTKNDEDFDELEETTGSALEDSDGDTEKESASDSSDSQDDFVFDDSIIDEGIPFDEDEEKDYLKSYEKHLKENN